MWAWECWRLPHLHSMAHCTDPITNNQFSTRRELRWSLPIGLVQSQPCKYLQEPEKEKPDPGKGLAERVV